MFCFVFFSSLAQISKVFCQFLLSRFRALTCCRCSAPTTAAWWARGLLQLWATSKILSSHTWWAEPRGEPPWSTGNSCNLPCRSVMLFCTLNNPNKTGSSLNWGCKLTVRNVTEMSRWRFLFLLPCCLKWLVLLHLFAGATIYDGELWTTV